MRTSVRQRLISFQESHELSVSWMYKDSKGLVSTGIGFLINGSADQAIAIGGWVDKGSGMTATNQEIRDEWQMIKDRSGPCDWRTMEALTNLRLPRKVIDDHVIKLAQSNINWLKSHGHDWDAYPADGQLGLLSLAWNGLGKYPRCLEVIKNGNWFYAAGEATFKGIPKRQEQTQMLLCNAGRVIARGLDPEVLYFDQRERGRVFVLKGNQYTSMKIYPDGEELESDRAQPVIIDKGTQPQTDWPGFQQRGFGSGVQAALNYGNGKLYFFKGNQYIRYDLNSYLTDGPFPIDTGQGLNSDWNGLKAVGFGGNIQAAVNWGDGRVFFFKDDSYVAYSIANNRVIDVRRPIDSESDPIHDWSGMKKAGFNYGIEAAVNWGDGRVFFFKGNQYVKFLIHPGTVADGYPVPIDYGWGNTLKLTGFVSNLDAIVDIN